jgi:anti-sigma regulatory factor (Ser/Thr protein kinase)
MAEKSILYVAANLSNLARIRDFVRKSVKLLGGAPAVVDDMMLAVDESVTNIITHGYRGQPGEIAIEMRKDGADFVVTLRDQAPPFDPTRVLPPDLTLPLEQRPLGGLGIFLTRQAVDHVMHRVTGDGGNELTLVKHAN